MMLIGLRNNFLLARGRVKGDIMHLIVELAVGDTIEVINATDPKRPTATYHSSKTMKVTRFAPCESCTVEDVQICVHNCPNKDKEENKGD